MIALMRISVLGFAVAAFRGDSGAPETLPDVLAQARAALGRDAAPRLDGSVRVEGRSRRNGLDAEYSLLFAGDGRFVLATGGRLATTVGFDGEAAWEVGPGGLARTLELGDREDALFAAWVPMGLWLEPAESGRRFEVSRSPERDDEGSIAISLKLRGGVKGLTLFLARDSHLPVALESTGVSGVERTTFADFDRSAGFAFPRRIVRTSAGLSFESEARSIAKEKPGAPDPFARVAGSAASARFREGVSSRLESRRARTGHTLVRAEVAGTDVGWFIFDSGAGGMVIDRAAAEKAGLEAFGEVTAVGVGGPVKTRFRECREFSIGPLVIENVAFTELELGFLSAAFGVPIGGVCGYDVFGRAVVEFDAARETIDLHDPARFDGAGLTFVELFLGSKVPSVRCRFEGDREEIFRLDTGAGGSLAFHAPAVKRLGLLDGRETKQSVHGGVGGVIQARSGKLGWFEIGGRRFEPLEAQFSLAESGAFTDPYTAGNVGGDVLSRFRIVFDYPRKRIAFAPSAER